MKIASLPQSVMARLLQLESDARIAQATARDAADAVADARKKHQNSIEREDMERVEATLPRLIAEAEGAAAHSSSLSTTVERCRQYLDALPDGTILELYKPQLDPGVDPALALSTVRQHLATAINKRNALAAIPIPSNDIEERVRDHVADLAQHARPYIRGIAKGNRLSVKWPPTTSSTVADTLSWVSDTCNPLTMAALLHPDELAQAILNEIEREANQQMPIPQREARIAELSDEIAELQRQASDLVYELAQSGDARTYQNAPPAAVLGVVVADERVAA